MADDADLLKLVAEGDCAAMRSLYERHYDALYAFLRSRGADAQNAADTLHDTMLDVWRKAESYGGQASVKTWMFTIARNKLVDRIRRTARVSYTDEVPETIDPAPDPEAVAVAASDAARVRICLSKLKPAHLTVIRLAFYENMTYSEIGAVEGAPEGTIKTRIFHAKKLLMRCLGRQMVAR